VSFSLVSKLDDARKSQLAKSVHAEATVGCRISFTYAVVSANWIQDVVNTVVGRRVSGSYQSSTVNEFEISLQSSACVFMLCNFQS
jgi:hypothetical protein